MADVKISQLPASTTPLDGTEVLPIVQSATTKQVSVANLTAGRAVSALSLSLTNALPVTSGGTGIQAAAQGSLLSATGANTFSATATPTLGVAGTTAGTLGLSGSSSGVVTLATASGAAGTWTMRLPTTGGTNGYILTTDGSGVTTWTNPTALGVDLDVGTTAITNGTAGYVLFQGAGNVLQENSNLFWDNTNYRLGIGTASPAQSLDLRGANAVAQLKATGTNGAATLVLDGADSGSYPGVTLRQNGTSFWSLQQRADTNLYLYRESGSGNIIANSGDFLIGTSTDRLRLTVSGSATVASPTLGTASGTAYFCGPDTAYGLMIGQSGSGRPWLQAQRVDGTATAYDILLQPSGGFVGIGTVAPSSMLYIKPPAAQASNIKLENSDGSRVWGLVNGVGSATDGLFSIYDYTAGQARLNVNSSGYVGVGTTSPTVTLQTAGGFAVQGPSGYPTSGGGWEMYVADTANVYLQAYNRTASSYAYTANYNAYAHQFKSQGNNNVLINNFGQLSLTTATQDQFTVASNSAANGASIRIANGNGTTTPYYSYIDYVNYSSSQYAWAVGTFGSNSFTFYDRNASSPRVTIDTSGNLLVGTTSSSGTRGGGKLLVDAANGTTPIAAFTNTTSGNAYVIATSLESAANNTSSFHLRSTTQSVGTWYLYGNGSSSFSSDERLKKDIQTARDGYLDDLMKLRVVKYRWHNQDEDTPQELGFIAQEMEQVFPGLVIEHELEGAGVRKNIKHSVMEFILTKAIQELAAKVSALEAKQ